MADLTGKKGMHQLNLLATFKPSQYVKKDGATIGAYVDVMKDLSGYSDKDIEDGKVDLHPHLINRKTTNQNGKPYTSHDVFYSSDQIMAMSMAGQTAVMKDGSYVIAFKGDVGMHTDGKTGETRVAVMTPKNLDKIQDPKVRDKAKAFNERHPMGRSDNEANFDEDILTRHEDVLSRAWTLEKAKTKDGPSKVDIDKTMSPTAKQNLIISYGDDDVVSVNGKVTGAYATVQRDQSTLSFEDVKAGKGISDPYLVTDTVTFDMKDGKRTKKDHSAFYTLEQLEDMEEAGKGVLQDNGVYAIAVKADLQEVPSASGKPKLFVVASPESLEASDNIQFGANSLSKQDTVTMQTRLFEKQKQREARLARMGYTEPVAEQQDSLEME